MRRLLAGLAVFAAAAAAVGCASHKEPATQAVTDIETSLNALRPEASRLAPEQLQRAEAGAVALKDSLARSQYKDVVDRAPGVSREIAALQERIAARRAELETVVAAATDQWDALNADVPRMIAAVEARVQVLGDADELPPNVSPAALQSARDSLDAMKSAWTEAVAMLVAGNGADAVTKGQAVKEKGNQVLQQLGRK